MSRPTTLTYDMITDICKYIRQGNYDSTSALAVGVSPDLLSLWKSKGRKARKDNISNIYRELFERMMIAGAKAEIDMVAIIRTEPKGDRFLLSRRFRERWMNELNVNMSPQEIIVTYAEGIDESEDTDTSETNDSSEPNIK